MQPKMFFFCFVFYSSCKTYSSNSSGFLPHRAFFFSLKACHFCAFSSTRVAKNNDFLPLFSFATSCPYPNLQQCFEASQCLHSMNESPIVLCTLNWNRKYLNYTLLTFNLKLKLEVNLYISENDCAGS